MVCPRCNSTISDVYNFCIYCGYALKSTKQQNFRKTNTQQLGLKDPVLVENPSQLKAALNSRCAMIYLVDKDLSDEMKLFFSPTAAIAWFVLVLVAMFNGLAIIAAIAFVIAIIGHGLAFIRFFVEGKYNYKKYVTQGKPPIQGAANIYYVHRKYISTYEMNNVRTVDAYNYSKF